MLWIPSVEMEDVIDSAELRKALGHHVRRLRLLNGWTQQELAEKIGISYVHVNRIENGHQLPSLEVSFSLADLFGVEVDSFRRIPSFAP